MPKILVNSSRVTRIGGDRWIVTLHVSDYISEMVQDRDIVAVEI